MDLSNNDEICLTQEEILNLYNEQGNVFDNPKSVDSMSDEEILKFFDDII